MLLDPDRRGSDPISPSPNLRRSFTGATRGLALLGLVALLLGLVAWTAPGVTSGRAGVDATGSTPSGADRVLISLVAAAWGAGAVLLIFIVLSAMRRPEEDDELVQNERTVRAWWLPWLAMLIIATSLVVPVLLIGSTRSNVGRVPASESTGTTPSVPPPATASGGRQTSPSAWVILAALVGGSVAWFALVRRKRLPPEDRSPLPDELVRVVDDSIHDIESDPDPRRAIIRAYARMEGVLARGGVPRRP